MNPIKPITTYVRTSIAELKKVSWPSKDKTIRYSALVIVVSIAVAAFFAALDFGFSRLVTLLVSQKAVEETVPETPVVPDVVPTVIEGEGDQVNTITSEPIEDTADIEPSLQESDSSLGEGIDLPPIE